MRPQSCVGNGQKYPQAERKGKSHIQLALRSLEPTSTILNKNPRKQFVEDSRASTHMVSGRDLNSDELVTVRISKNPTTGKTANGEVQTNEEATVFRPRP